jgi:catechol-2,3-dioxygenase
VWLAGLPVVEVTADDVPTTTAQNRGGLASRACVDADVGYALYHSPRNDEGPFLTDVVGFCPALGMDVGLEASTIWRGPRHDSHSPPEIAPGLPFHYTDAKSVKGLTMANIKKVGHVVLGVRDPERSIRFYTETLGMECVNKLEDMQMAFFSFGERDHDIAVIKVPDEQPVGSSGFAHTALEIDGGEAQLRELYQSLKNHGVNVELTADHTLTKSVYFMDPDGNRLEIFSQVLPAPIAKQTLHDFTGAAQDAMLPLDLESPMPAVS